MCECSIPPFSFLLADADDGQPNLEIDVAGPAVLPLDFPTPSIGHAEHQNDVSIIHHASGRIIKAKHVIVPFSVELQRKRRLSIASQPNHAYLTKKRLSTSTFGQVRLCVVLRRRESSHVSASRNYYAKSSYPEWETTNQLVVLKSSLRDSFSRNRSTLRKDPYCEVAAQQYVGNYHPHCLGCHEAFQDEQFLYSVLKYCPGGDLYNKLLREASPLPGSSDSDNSSTSTSESQSMSYSKLLRPLGEGQARVWFRQLLQAIAHLQKKGICHGGLSLENILLDEDGNVLLSDFAQALRIPYDDESRNMGGGGVTDVSEGFARRLMRCVFPSSPHKKSTSTGINQLFLAPELVHIGPNKVPASSVNKIQSEERCFDGFAVDLWSLGIVLFVMLTGSVPFRIAHDSDPGFVQISKRGMLHKLPSLRDLSPDAVDLLQNMLWAHSAKRFTLSDIMAHSWVSPPNVDIYPNVVDSQQDHVDRRLAKMRIHQLAFYNFHAMGGHKDATLSEFNLPDE